MSSETASETEVSWNTVIITLLSILAVLIMLWTIYSAIGAAKGGLQ